MSVYCAAFRTQTGSNKACFVPLETPFKNFEPKKFLQGVKDIDFKEDLNDADSFYKNISSAFREIVDRHAPLKT